MNAENARERRERELNATNCWWKKGRTREMGSGEAAVQNSLGFYGSRLSASFGQGRTTVDLVAATSTRALLETALPEEFDIFAIEVKLDVWRNDSKNRSELQVHHRPGQRKVSRSDDYTPIAELGFFGIAVGAALMGMRPIVDVQYGDFLFLASYQIGDN